jgi:predicted Fe-Mo cluster-binding NifX family protein
MRILVTSTGPGLDYLIDEEFGHAEYFVVIDPETMAFEAIKNQGHDAEMGAGIYAAEQAAKLGVSAVLTGWMGPHGQQTLTKHNIRIIMDEEGTVLEAVERFKRKHLKK